MAQQSTDKPGERKLGRPFGISSEDRRAKLLQAAGEQFNERPFSEVSMAEIAKSAGVTGAAIYNHFGSKNELFQETVKDRIIDYDKLVSDAIAVSGTWSDKLSNLIDVLVNRQKLGPQFPLIAAVVQARLNQEPDEYQEIRNLRNRSALIFRSLISQAVEESDLPKDTNISITGDLLMAIMTGAITTVAFYNQSSADIDAIGDSIKTLLGINR